MRAPTPAFVWRILGSAGPAAEPIAPEAVAGDRGARRALTRLGLLATFRDSTAGRSRAIAAIGAGARAARVPPEAAAGLLLRHSAAPDGPCGDAPRCPACPLQARCPFPARKPTIRDLPAEQRPRERLLAGGPEALGDAELLALVLGEGTRGETSIECARRLLARAGGLERLAALGPAELCEVRGIGPARAARVAAALELARRRSGGPLTSGRPLGDARSVWGRFVGRLRGARQETFLVVCLDSKNRVLRERTVSRGTLDASLVHPREVFGPAIRESAAAVLLIHNHPSGDPEPSPEDLAVTRRLRDAGRLLGIQTVDHIIVGAKGYVSFAERGLI